MTMGPVWPGVDAALSALVVVGLTGVLAVDACLPGFAGLMTPADARVATGAAGSAAATGAVAGWAAGAPVSMAVVPVATGWVWLMPFAARTSSSVYCPAQADNARTPIRPTIKTGRRMACSSDIRPRPGNE